MHHEVFVQLADEDHLRDLERFGVRDPVPVAELRREAEPLGERADLRAAAVHDDRLHADHPQQRDVLGEPRCEPRIGHRRSPDLDHHGRREMLPHVRQGIEQDPRFGERPLPHPGLNGQLRHVGGLGGVARPDRER